MRTDITPVPFRRRACLALAVVTALGLVQAEPAPAEVAVADATIDTVAGGPGGPGPGTSIGQQPPAVVVRGDSLYVADQPGSVVRVLDTATGTQRTVVGNGVAAFSGDGGAATAASLDWPGPLALDPAGNLYVGERNRVRRVDAASGVITTVAGDGTLGSSGDGGPATSAQVTPQSIAADSAGNLYIATGTFGKVRRVDAASGVITTVAGGGTGGDGGPATGAQLGTVMSVTVAPWGDLYIGTEFGGVRRVVAGADSVVDGDADEVVSTVGAVYATGLTVESSGALYAADGAACQVRRIAPGADGLVTGAGDEVVATVVGTGCRGFSGDGGPALSAQLNGPWGVAVDASGNLYVADAGNYRVRKVVSGADGVVDGDADEQISTVAGNGFGRFGGDGRPAPTAQLADPSAVTVDAAGNLYVADTTNARVRRIDPSGVITTVAGTGTAGFSGDGGPALSAKLNRPEGVALDAAGNLYVSDTLTMRVRKILAGANGVVDGNGDEIITTVAGGGTLATGPGTSVGLSQPRGLSFDGAGNLYVADFSNNRIVRVDALTGLATTVAGGGKSLDDGVPAATAELSKPRGVVSDRDGNLYVTDTTKSRIRRIEAVSSIITTVVEFSIPMAIDLNGTDLYMVDFGSRLFRIDLPTGAITHMAGNAVGGYSGDGGQATQAQLNAPLGIGVDDGGNVFIADTRNHRIRKVTPNVARVQATVADFGGDGTTDTAVFRPSNGTWYVRGASPDATPYGADGDIAVPADYDGDRKVDPTVFRPSNGTWYVRGATPDAVAFGADGDVPVPADYDGDGRADIAVFRPSNGTWYFRGAAVDSIPFGTSGDIPVPADYDGDGKADIAVFRPSTGTWYFRGASPDAVAFGTSGDIPVAADYDGDGKADLAVFRPSNGTWYVRGASPDAVPYGTGGDIPVPGDYDGNRTADIAVFRPSTGTWYVRGASPDSTPYGTSGDVPLAAPAAVRMAFFI